MIIGVGTDLVSVPRLRQAVTRRDRLLHRLFTEAEVAECRRRADPAPHLAARFAAKEACLKALQIGMGGGIRWREVEVEGGGGKVPRLILRGAAATRAAALGVRQTHLSLAHEGEYALAFVVATD
ncbi:MAG: holo-ACP synthase [Candidatus Methylomirabilales bacterium]